MYAVAPYRIGRPRIRMEIDRTQAGNPLLKIRVRVAPSEAMRERHVVGLRLFAPNGEEWRDFGAKEVATNGVANHRLVLPLNAPQGAWRLQACEAISGLSDEVTVEWP